MAREWEQGEMVRLAWLNVFAGGRRCGTSDGSGNNDDGDKGGAKAVAVVGLRRGGGVFTMTTGCRG